MSYSLTCGTQQGMSATSLFANSGVGSSVLEAMVAILAQPKLRQCLPCSGKGLLTPRALCPCCQGYGRTN